MINDKCFVRGRLRAKFGGGGYHAPFLFAGVSRPPVGKCPEIVAYLEAAAADNSMSEKLVVGQARKLYDILSERLHSGAVGSDGAPVRMPADVFERSGDPSRAAFAAFVAFAGRDMRLYDTAGCDALAPLALRARGASGR